MVDLDKSREFISSWKELNEKKKELKELGYKYIGMLKNHYVFSDGKGGSYFLTYKPIKKEKTVQDITGISDDETRSGECPVKENDLGEVLYIEFYQCCETHKMFDLYNGYASEKTYDTLFLKTFFRVLNFYDTKQNYFLSFYVKRKPTFCMKNGPIYDMHDLENEDTTSMTITKLKDQFSSCGVLHFFVDDINKTHCFFVDDTGERRWIHDPLKIAICKSVSDMDLNNDYFFENPFTFNAPSHDDPSSSISKYDIIGVNFRKER